MAKGFLTYSEQIENLQLKGMIVPDEDAANQVLHDVSYFALVTGYKIPLRNPMTRTYKPGVTFDDLLALYTFDEELRNLAERNIAFVERKLKSTLSYAFCENHGHDQAAYLRVENFKPERKSRKGVERLLKVLDGLANINTDYGYIVHHRKKYANVPLWVLVNAMTFGQASMMYSLLLPRDKAAIAKQFDHVNERELAMMMKYLVLYRNVCAHGERLFLHRAYSDIPNMPLHEKLGVAKAGQEYTQGKRDLFGLVIALRYLLPGGRFRTFKRQLSSLIERFLKDNSAVSRDELLSLMGFPPNWKSVTRYKL